jgi:hypothetical protein
MKTKVFGWTALGVERGRLTGENEIVRRKTTDDPRFSGQAIT